MPRYTKSMKALGNKIAFYQYNDKGNVGDVISEVILKHFLPDRNLVLVDSKQQGKLCAVGSIMSKVCENDILWGVGCIKANKIYAFRNLTVLAVRGKLTREAIRGVNVPEVYGDPALLLPLIYNPQKEKTVEVGYIPHYIDKPLFEGKDYIDVALPWKDFVDKVVQCKEIVSSSLHGIIIAEAYGIPATWAVYSDGVIGRGLKFKDYLTGTGRSIQGTGKFPPIKNLEEIQQKLIKALKDFYI